MSATKASSSRRASLPSTPSGSSSSGNGLRIATPPTRRGSLVSTSLVSPTTTTSIQQRSSTGGPSPRSPGGTAPSAASPPTSVRRTSSTDGRPSTPKASSPTNATVRRGSGGASPKSPVAGTTTPAAVKAALLKVSESVEAAVAALDLEMPTLDLALTGQAYLPAESRRSPSPGDRRGAALPSPQPAIAVRPQSPSALRPVVATEIAFGRHQSPPRSRPPSPPRPVPATAPAPVLRQDTLRHCDNNCGRDAAMWCEQCQVEICPPCDATIHGTNAALRRHARVHLVDRLPICPRHKEACRLFCSDCCALLCQLCVPTDAHKFPDGRGHPIFDCNVAADARRPEILALASTLREAADSAPASLRHLQKRQQQMHDEIHALGAQLSAAVDAVTARLRAELDAFLLVDTDHLTRYISSTDAARQRLLLDVEVAESVSGLSTPPQSFLSQWRELRGVLQEAARSRLGQEEPPVRMHVALTGQVQSGKILTLEMELQRVVDALNKVGAITALPNGRHVVLLPVPAASPERPERRER